MAYDKNQYRPNGGKLLDKNGELVEVFDMFAIWNNIDYFGALGLMEGILTFKKFGRGRVDSNLTTIWPDSGETNEPFLPVVPEEMFVVCDANDVGKKMKIYSLDENWEIYDFEVTLTGTSTSIGTIARVNRAINYDPVKFEQDVTIQNAGGDKMAIILALTGTTEQAIYTVPVGYTAMVTAFNADGARGNDIVVYNFYKEFGFSERSARSTDLYRNIKDKEFRFPTIFTEKTDIYQRGEATSGRVYVSSGFDVVLISNEQLAYFQSE